MRRSIVVRCSVAALLIACGCQGPAGDGEASTESAAGGRLQSRIVHALPRGGQSVVSFRTLPNAACTLTGPGVPTGEQLRLFSDDEGMVRLHLRHVSQSVSAGELGVSCADEHGATMGHTISVVAQDRAVAQAPAPFSHAGKPSLPVLDVDPMTLRSEDLVARNYPPRPDAAANPDQYDAWLRLVTSSPTVVKAHLVADPTRVHGPARANGNGTSNNWSGYVLTTPSSASEYAWIYGEWTVPRVYAESGFYSSDHSSEWVGIDGWGSPDVVQDGTEANTLTVFWVQTSSYDAWIEWYPLSEQAVSNFPVNPGDDIHAWTWLKNSAGNYDPNPTVGWFYLWNATQNVYSYQSLNIPSGTVFNGHSAEWVMERPSVNGSLSHLSQYASPASITNALAYDLNGATHLYGGDASDTSWNVTMTNGSTVLSRVAPVNSSTMSFTWVNHN